MSRQFPIIAATGSSGAGTSTVKLAFEHIFNELQLKPAYVEGDAFHAYDRKSMQEAVRNASIRGENFSHFGPAANHFDKLEQLFRIYGESGEGEFRHYIHTDEGAKQYGMPESGTFTEWQPIEPATDILFYEGLHAGVSGPNINIAQHVDLLVGIVPTINLEWVQKTYRDTVHRGYSTDDVMKNILRRMYDYVHYIVPQFSNTDINFQRVPTVDVSNPFNMREIPTADESNIVISFRNPHKLGIDFPYLLNMIHDSFMSKTDTIVVPGGKMGMAIELIFPPLIAELMMQRDTA